MCASNHKWFGGIKSRLHIAIVVPTSALLGLYFTPEETLLVYYNILNEIITRYSILAEILTDNRTAFEYKRKNTSSQAFDNSLIATCNDIVYELKEKTSSN